MSEKSASALAIAKEIFGIEDEEVLSPIIWGCTGYPMWFHIPEDGKDNIECFRTQLWEAKIALAAGFDIDDIFEGKNQLIQEEEMEFNRILARDLEEQFLAT